MRLRSYEDAEAAALSKNQSMHEAFVFPMCFLDSGEGIAIPVFQMGSLLLPGADGFV